MRRFKLSTEGIGWAIAAVIVFWVAPEMDGFIDTITTIGIGLTFLAVYLVKQFFDPEGIGWFIAGGFCASCAILNGFDPATLAGLILAGIFFFTFYGKNREDIDAVLRGETIQYYDDNAEAYADDYPVDPVVEEVVEEVITEVPAAAAGSDVEFEFYNDTDGTED